MRVAAPAAFTGGNTLDMGLPLIEQPFATPVDGDEAPANASDLASIVTRPAIAAP